MSEKELEARGPQGDMRHPTTTSRGRHGALALPRLVLLLYAFHLLVALPVHLAVPDTCDHHASCHEPHACGCDVHPGAHVSEDSGDYAYSDDHGHDSSTCPFCAAIRAGKQVASFRAPAPIVRPVARVYIERIASPEKTFRACPQPRAPPV